MMMMMMMITESFESLQIAVNELRCRAVQAAQFH